MVKVYVTDVLLCYSKTHLQIPSSSQRRFACCTNISRLTSKAQLNLIHVIHGGNFCTLDYCYVFCISGFNDTFYPFRPICIIMISVFLKEQTVIVSVNNLNGHHSLTY
jgi:hypothetical protein